MTQLEQNFLEAATRFCRDHYTKDNNNVKEIDWEQRRYEIAKGILNAVIQRPDMIESARLSNMSTEKYSAITAISFADILIEELKK